MRRFPLWLLPVVAAVLLGVVLATIERGPPDDAAVADGLSENLLDVPVVARPPLEFLERFDLAADAPLVATPDPNQEIESLLKPRLSVWGPVAPHESVWAYSWVVDHSSGAPAVIVADPTVLQRVAAYEAVADVDGSPVRMLVAGDSRTLEWDAGGYGMTVIGYGIEPEPLLLLAAIVHIDQKTGAPTLLGVPEGFEVTAATVASSSTAGPGQQGWKARYVIRGGDGTSFELVASSGRAIPVEELHAQVGLEHMVEVRGQSA
ncbi:MAG: hypothetical protein GWN79_13575, partial [Actinobacteria bacterium]|nr:hypothetical protein [Actinomycetota bacterium]NIS32580.1 hypothetical protein [Actinomycetota bacterium]NIT96337.1 hypothetical protein [Actinomycetota bacterium]NIU20053.1 hypothetical protein [Actinomycetota bacterium]NIU67595.1 hypothetical protein [Actinomycetota bacterium]